MNSNLPVFQTLDQWHTWLSHEGINEENSFKKGIETRHFYSLEGCLHLNLLPRLQALIHHAPADAALTFSWVLNSKAIPLPQLSLSVKNESSQPWNLICQRCLSPMPFSLESHSSFWIAPTEDYLESTGINPEDEAFFYEEPMHILQQIEDEALLALPYSPRHSENQCKIGASQAEPAQQKPHPFAVLAQLKKNSSK